MCQQAEWILHRILDRGNKLRHEFTSNYNIWTKQKQLEAYKWQLDNGGNMLNLEKNHRLRKGKDRKNLKGKKIDWKSTQTFSDILRGKPLRLGHSLFIHDNTMT